MKIALLLVTISLLTNFSSIAQCTPDLQYTSPGFYPDSATGLELAIVIYQIPTTYSETITYVVPADTSTLIGQTPVTLAIDSVVLIGFTGFPQGFSYSCFDDQNVASPVDGCSFEGGTIGCIGIDGVPEYSDQGDHPISLSFDMYIEGLTTPSATFTNEYTLQIVHGDVWPINLDENAISRYKLFPNPASNSLKIVDLEGTNVSSLSISNAEGKELGLYSDINSTSFDIDISALKSGVYFLRFASDTSSKVERFVKN